MGTGVGSLALALGLALPQTLTLTLAPALPLALTLALALALALGHRGHGDVCDGVEGECGVEGGGEADHLEVVGGRVRFGFGGLG